MISADNTRIKLTRRVNVPHNLRKKLKIKKNKENKGENKGTGTLQKKEIKGQALFKENKLIQNPGFYFYPLVSFAVTFEEKWREPNQK